MCFYTIVCRKYNQFQRFVSFKNFPATQYDSHNEKMLTIFNKILYDHIIIESENLENLISLKA